MNLRARLCGCLFVVMLLLLACNKGGGGGTHGGNGPVPPPPAGAPVVTFEPRDDINLNATTKNQIVTITNTDTSIPVLISAITLESPLSVNRLTNTCLTQLGPKTSCTYEIDFDSTSSKSGQKIIPMQYTYLASDGIETQVPFGNLNVNYNASIPGEDTQLTSSPSSVSFDMSKPNQPVDVILTNQNPSVPLNISASVPSLTSPFLIDFSGCRGLTLDQKTKFCKYTITFDGTSATSQTLTIPYSYTKDGKSISKNLSTTVQSTKATSFKVFLNHTHGDVILSDSNPLKLVGKYVDQTVSGSNYTSTYGFFDSLVLYNTSSSPIQITIDRNTPIKDSAGNTIDDLKVDISKCGVNPKLAPHTMCGIQVIYKPTKVVSTPTMAYLTLTSSSSSGDSIRIPIQYSASAETKNDAYMSAAKTFLSNSDANRVAVYNNCSQPLWIQNTAVISNNSFSFISPNSKSSQTEIKPQSFYVLDSDIIDNLKSKFSGYSLDQGYPGFNIYAKFGCDSSGTHCASGEAGQPPIFPLFEGTLGCKTGVGGTCIGGLNPSSPADFIDLSLLQGFNYNIGLDIWKTSDESNVACFSNAESTLSPSDCPKDENLTSTPDTWAVMDKDDHRWDWTDEQPPLGWSPDYLGVVVTIGQSIWIKSIGAASEIDNGGSSSIRSKLYSWKKNGLTFQACNDSKNTGICDTNQSTFSTFPYWKWDQTNQQNVYSPFQVYCVNNKHKQNDQRDTNQTFNMDKMNLSLMHDNAFFGCAAPSKYLNSNFSYNAPALSSECVYVGSLYSSAIPADGNVSSIPNSYYYSRYLDRDPSSPPCGKDGTNKPDQVKQCLRASGYKSQVNSQRIMFENPYTGEDLAFPDTKGQFAAEYKSTSAKIYQELADFCKNNPDFCQENGKSRDSLAGLIGSMGPISKVKYYDLLKQKGGPNYIWQYGDQDASRVCDKKPKYVVLFCGKNPSSSSAFPLPSPK